MNRNITVHGNYTDKYNTRNPISKLLMNGFLNSFDAFLTTVQKTGVNSICEVGCAEGELLKHVRAFFPHSQLSATDISGEEIEKAKNNCSGLDVNFSVQNAEEMTGYEDSSFDLVVCCEVLEHLDDPALGLRELHRLSRKYALVSVPHEPIWRVLNVMRGKYLKRLGNTPGHLNHWNMIQFQKFLKTAKFTIVKKKYPLPWQMVLLVKQP